MTGSPNWSSSRSRRCASTRWRNFPARRGPRGDSVPPAVMRRWAAPRAGMDTHRSDPTGKDSDVFGRRKKNEAHPEPAQDTAFAEESTVRDGDDEAGEDEAGEQQ